MADLRLRQRIGNTAFSALPAGFFIVQAPVPLLAPYLVAFNPELAAQFGLEPTLELVDRLLRALQADRVDYPAFMRSLGVFRPEDNAHDARQARRDAVNPLYVCCALMWPNGPIHLAIDQRDYNEMERLRRLLAQPFTPRRGARGLRRAATG